MDCRPDSLETVLYTWGAFGLIVAPSLFVAERLIDGYASKMTRRAQGGGGYGDDGAASSSMGDRDQDHRHNRDIAPSVSALNMSFVLYALLLTCLLVLLSCIVIYSGVSLLHMCIEALFRMEPTLIGKRSVRQLLHAADNLLDPALIFGFLSIRTWGVHASVLLATLAASAMHTWLLLSPARLRAMTRRGGGVLSAEMVAGAFRETYGLAVSMMVTLYLIIVAREVMLFLELRK